jgi:histidinol-phosphate/aromatic aminotransferase/cobyric acid decarboxylase-like protein
METVVPCSDEYPQLSLEASHLKGYKMDTGDVLWTEKQQIASLVAAFDSKLINTDEFTLAPGVSSALLIIMAALKSMGIGEIIFELPAYFAGIEQAELLGLNVGLFPASPSSGYRITPQDIIDIDRISSAPVALMITQPRYGLGYNRKTEELLKLREALRPGDIIVVDEAADQSAPSPFG